MKINGNDPYNLVDMLKIFGNRFKSIKGVQLCACSHFSGYTTNLFYMPPNLPRALGKGAVSSSFISSGNTSQTYISDMSQPISTKLDHKNPWPRSNMSYDPIGVKGHVGVTGVKKVIS